MIRLHRQFLVTSAVAAILVLGPRHVLGATPGEGESEKIDASFLSLRDIFKAPDIVKDEKDDMKSDLEIYPITDFKMIGVMTGPERAKGMVLLPNKKTYFVSEQDRVGTRSGVIMKITPEAITIREKIVNVLGQEEDVNTEIKLQSALGEGGGK